MVEIAKKDEEEKIGSIKLSKNHKLAISKLVSLPEWNYIEDWFRQRQLQIATTGITLAQTETELFKFKGKVEESRHSVLSLRKVAEDYRKSEKKDS